MKGLRIAGRIVVILGLLTAAFCATVAVQECIAHRWFVAAISFMCVGINLGFTVPTGLGVVRDAR